MIWEMFTPYWKSSQGLEYSQLMYKSWSPSDIICKFLPHVFSFCTHIYRLWERKLPGAGLQQKRSLSRQWRSCWHHCHLRIVHHNPKLKLVLACGAFAYGVRAVLAHKVPDNSERHIRYAVLTESREELLSSWTRRSCLHLWFNLCREAVLTSFLSDNWPQAISCSVEWAPFYQTSSVSWDQKIVTVHLTIRVHYGIQECYMSMRMC